MRETGLFQTVDTTSVNATKLVASRMANICIHATIFRLANGTGRE